MPSTPTAEDQEDVLLSTRFGDLPDVEHFVSAFSPHALDAVTDDNGNSVLHMAAGNGHTREHPPLSLALHRCQHVA